MAVPGYRAFLRSPPLRGEHSRHGEEQPIHKLIVHDYQRGIYPVHSEKERPQIVEAPVKKNLGLPSWNRAAAVVQGRYCADTARFPCTR